MGHKVADFASADASTRKDTPRLARCETAISLVSSLVCASVKKQQLEVLLQQVRPHPHPASELEQYSTPAQIATDVLWLAHAQGDIVGKRVADLGCGTAILGIGAKLLGASEVVAVDIDGAALAVATQNATRLNVTLSFLTMDVRDFAGSADTVLMNPPFGAQNPHADIPFLERALGVAPVVYTFHKAETEPFVVRRIEGFGGNPTHRKRYRFPIPHTMPFHREEVREVPVVLLRIVRQR